MIVFKLDRLSRSQKDTLYLIEDVFIPNKVEFVSLGESIDTSSPTGKLMIGILSAFAQLERENIRIRTRMGMKERVKSGLWMGGGRVPFGYDYDEKQGILVPNKDAETVRLIYELYCQGKGYQEISDILGVTNDSLVRNIILRKTYLGIIEYNGKEYTGKHQPIITQELYDKAHYILSHKKCNNTFTNSNYLLTGLIRCGKCGARMRYQKWGNDPSDVKILCYSQQKTKKYLVKDPNCTQPKLWADGVESRVIDCMFEFAENYKSSNSKSDQKSKKEINVMDLLLDKKIKLEKKIRRLYSLYADDGDTILLDSINELKKELDNVQNEYNNEKNNQDSISKAVECVDMVSSIKSIWDALSGNEKHKIISSIVKEVIITDNVVDIHFYI